MTNCIIALSLIITPSPVTARQETPLWTAASAAVSIAVGVPTISPSLIEASFEAESSYVATEPPAPNEPPLPVPDIPPPAPPPELTPIEQGLNRLSELGANEWQIRTFGCIAWFESGNNPNAWNPYSRDAGLWQLNLRYHAWRWAGRDIFDPVVNAEIAWQVYSESGFRAWVVHSKCGV